MEGGKSKVWLSRPPHQQRFGADGVAGLAFWKNADDLFGLAVPFELHNTGGLGK